MLCGGGRGLNSFLFTKSPTPTSYRVIKETNAVSSSIDAAVHCWLSNRTPCIVEDAQFDSDCRDRGDMAPSWGQGPNTRTTQQIPQFSPLLYGYEYCFIVSRV